METITVNSQTVLNDIEKLVTNSTAARITFNNIEQLIIQTIEHSQKKLKELRIKDEKTLSDKKYRVISEQIQYYRGCLDACNGFLCIVRQ